MLKSFKKIKRRKLLPMKKQKKNKRAAWFELLKRVMRLFIKETKFEYEAEHIEEPAIILCNHVGTAAPLAWELYGDVGFRFWGASEMNSGLAALYKYQSRVFYHEKKGWNLHLSRLFCLIASPMTYMFYAGLNLISTYQDARFKHTLTESIQTLENGQSLVIFPEISDNGYLDVLEGFHKGCVMLAGICYNRGMDIPVYVSYFRNGDPKRLTVGKRISLRELFEGGGSRDEVAQLLCDECNRLGSRILSEEKEQEGEKSVANG